MQTAHREFLDNLSISTDRKTGFIKISYVHFSPDVAKEIVSTIVEEVNEDLRLEDIYQAEESIKILTNEYENTQLNQIRSGLSYLIQQNIEKKTTALQLQNIYSKFYQTQYLVKEKWTPKTYYFNYFLYIIFNTFYKYLLFRKIFKVQKISMNVLLTGGLGFIGGHTAISLSRIGHSVYIYDSLINSGQNFHRDSKPNM